MQLKLHYETNFLYSRRYWNSEANLATQTENCSLHSPSYFSACPSALFFSQFKLFFFACIKTTMRLATLEKWKDMQMLLWFCVINFPIYRDKPHRRSSSFSRMVCNEVFKCVFILQIQKKCISYWSLKKQQNKR